tara:strand:+ start:54 stop:1907 length:1854 start_codon:yes stop_codon:yes gene_type:complete
MAHAAERLPVTIDGRSYLIETEGYSRTTVQTLREQRDTSGEAGEQRLNTQFWVRSQTDWSRGAGQEYFDNDDSDRRRFYTSSGIDPWTKGQVSLLPITEDKGNTGNDVIMKVFTGSGTDYMYVASGTDLYYSSNFDTASPTWNTVTALASPQTITDFTSDGTSIFIAYGSARHLAKTGINSTTQPSSLGSSEPDKLRYVGGRLIELDGNTIEELAANGSVLGSATFSLTHGSVWEDVCVGPVGLYAAANSNNTGSLYFLAAGNDGAITSPQQVADLPRGETINAIESYGGLLLIATSQGLRVASMNQDASVSYGPVIDNGGEAFSLATGDRFVWFGTGSGQVYRADLSVFTETLVPAWASDVVSTGGSAGNVTWAARVNGKVYFVDAANGVQGEAASGDRVASGTLTVGDVRWNSQFDKSLRQVEVRASPTLAVAGATEYNQSGETYNDSDLFYNGLAAPVSGTIKVTFTPDTGNDLAVLTLTDRVSKVVEYSLSDKYTVKFTLERDATTTTAGPNLESWQLLAFPAPTRIDEIVLPVVMKKRVASSRGMGAAVQQDPQGEYDALRALMVAKRVVTYQEGSRSDTVVIDQMSMSAEHLSADGDWWEGTMTLRILTVP